MEALYQDLHHGLVAECKNGSRKAQYELYKLYSKAMYNVAVRIVGNEDEAADVLQDSFIDAFNRIADFRQESTFGFWIKQIVVNKAIGYLRKRRVEFVPIDEADVGSIEYETEDESEIQFRVEQVKQGIMQLPDKFRIVISLFVLEGYDHEEIAHILKISENNSRIQLLRAKRMLLDLLKKGNSFKN